MRSGQWGDCDGVLESGDFLLKNTIRHGALLPCLIMFLKVLATPRICITLPTLFPIVVVED